MLSKKLKLSLMALLTVSTVLTACSSKAADEKSSDETSGNISAVTADDTTEDAATAEETIDETSEGETSVTYPITIKHAFGETVIESKPERIATIGWGNHDVPLALGIIPVGVSKANYGPVDENGLLPWTADKFKELGVENPVAFDDIDGLDFEAISDANPDVILAAYSGFTKEDYDLLSQIAPVVAYPRHPWQTYWREQTLMNAQGMGMEAEAKQLITETEELIASKVKEYDALQGKTAAFFYFTPSDLGTFYVYLPTDPRAAYLTDFGLAFPESVLNLADDPTAFSVTLSSENVDTLNDIDIIIAYGDDSVLEVLQADPLVGQIPAIANGAVVLLDSTSPLSAAGSPSILSIPATIDEYLELLNKAAEKVK